MSETTWNNHAFYDRVEAYRRDLAGRSTILFLGKAAFTIAGVIGSIDPSNRIRYHVLLGRTSRWCDIFYQYPPIEDVAVHTYPEANVERGRSEYLFFPITTQQLNARVDIGLDEGEHSYNPHRINEGAMVDYLEALPEHADYSGPVSPIWFANVPESTAPQPADAD